MDWKGLSGFRNVLTHGYLDIRLERVWTVLERDLPTLKAAISELLRQARDEPVQS